MRVHLNNGVTSVKQRSLRVHGSSLGPNHDSGENGKQRKIYISKIAELHFFSLPGTRLVNAGEQQGRTEKKTFKCMEVKAYSRPLSLWFSLCK